MLSYVKTYPALPRSLSNRRYKNYGNEVNYWSNKQPNSFIQFEMSNEENGAGGQNDENKAEIENPIFIEDKYLYELVNEILRFMVLKRNGSLLVLGGKSWPFAKAVWQNSTVPTLVYADQDEQSLREADEEEALTVECDLSKPEEIAKLGKYDGIVVKNALENLAGSEDESKEERLNSYMTSIYKILKYGGKAILATRLDPSLNLPSQILAEWSKSMPNLDDLTEAAKNTEFELKHQILKYQICIDKNDWRKILTQKGPGSLIPEFLEKSISDEILDKFFQSQDETIKFEDKIDIILLTKEILEDF